MKLTQRELLYENSYWDKFPAVKGAIQTGREIAKVVAPEITEPIEKIRQGGREAKKNIQRAIMSRDEIVKEQIIEAGFYPNTENGKESKVKWGGKNTDGTLSGTIKVGELGYTDTGEPYMLASFKNTLKDDVVFKFDPHTRDIKIVRAPYRNAGVESPPQKTSPNNS